MPCFLVLVLVLATQAAGAAPPRVVAAEAVYAGLARQIGGPAVSVTAILQNPAQDPHLVEAAPSVARALTGAQLVIYNGAGYDPWVRPLLAATAGLGMRRVIDVADLVHAGAGGNPHLWYAPQTMPALAAAIAHALSDADPAGAAGYARGLAAAQADFSSLAAQAAALRVRHAGQAVAATEPVFGPMLTALGLRSLDGGLQRAVMNDTEPSAADMAQIEADLRGHKVRALLRNRQTDDDMTRRLVEIARQSGVPVVAVSETEPAGMSYRQWVGAQLEALGRALDQ